jgi:hypothetical protein
MQRRKLLLTSAFTALALAGCAVSTVNGVTTLTVNLAAVNAYAQAVENSVTLLTSNPLIAAAIPAPAATIIKAAQAAVGTAIAALDKEYAGQISFSFDATNVPAALLSLQADASTIFAGFQTVAEGIGAAVPAAVSQALLALQTIVSLVNALTIANVGAVETPMPADTALAVLGVKAP